MKTFDIKELDYLNIKFQGLKAQREQILRFYGIDPIKEGINNYYNNMVNIGCLKDPVKENIRDSFKDFHPLIDAFIFTDILTR